MNFRKILAVAALPLVALPTAAFAQDGEEESTGAFDISAEVGVLSDYRFRGMSLSGKEPEITAELSVSHESGFYATAWASNVELGNGKANNVEVDWTAGWTKDIGNVTVDGGVIYYSYANNANLNYVELFGSLGTKVGPADVTVGVAYAPSQDNLGNTDNTYVFISGDLPLGESPLSLHGTFGIEDGAFGDKKKDWLVGMSYDLGRGFTAKLDYVDTARSFSPMGDATVVGSLTFAF